MLQLAVTLTRARWRCCLAGSSSSQKKNVFCFINIQIQKSLTHAPNLVEHSGLSFINAEYVIKSEVTNSTTVALNCSKTVVKRWTFLRRTQTSNKQLTKSWHAVSHGASLKGLPCLHSKPWWRLQDHPQRRPCSLGCGTPCSFFRWDIQIQRSPYHPSWVFIRGKMLWVRLIVLRICLKIVCSSPLSCDTPCVFSFSLRYTNSTS